MRRCLERMERMNIEIKALTPELEEVYFDFFDNRAFSDGSPYYPCYCNAFNMSREQIEEELFAKSESYGGGAENWKRALRESAVKMVRAGLIKGYLAFADGLAVGWCNANDRMNYYRVGEFDLDNVPSDEKFVGCKEKGQIRSVVCFEIAPDYRGKGIGRELLTHIEDFIRSELKEGWWSFLQLISAKGKEEFYLKCGYKAHPHERSGAGFTKVIEG